MNIVLSNSTVYIQRPYVVTDLLDETGVSTVRTVQVSTDRTTSANSPLTYKIREKFRAIIQYIRESNIKNYSVDEKNQLFLFLLLTTSLQALLRKFAVISLASNSILTSWRARAESSPSDRCLAAVASNQGFSSRKSWWDRPFQMFFCRYLFQELPFQFVFDSLRSQGWIFAVRRCACPKPRPLPCEPWCPRWCLAAIASNQVFSRRNSWRWRNILVENRTLFVAHLLPPVSCKMTSDALSKCGGRCIASALNRLAQLRGAVFLPVVSFRRGMSAKEVD